MRDLTAAVAAVTTAVSDATSELNNIAAKLVQALNNPGPGGIDPTAVESAAQSLSAQAAALESAITAANTTITPPAPVTTPAPSPTTSTPGTSGPTTPTL